MISQVSSTLSTLTRADPETFKHVKKWYDDVKANRDNAVIAIVGNKKDLGEHRYPHSTT
jgi:GTPase SAR1 family protein